ncbi:cytochrome ubiquinol oxidase subunit I [Sphaerisporangium krabiense]|uniref:Cytochrome d ubiquinol oxidase subunit I n=1 Tax=Sphaerisporangium krabiense TaxID=763782 RepID=A0A7W8Z8Z3_9ACTN|nr:cytochrome ubiquinol oxidase subunit I [Sphaerisporangium krabiense]MBB5629697.1 cytochrome d ubiquinol oxidase subunit I [Sphaerisporangium krabiense]GII63796.1 cytochrome ubiquinol oxidase subunit I [Sphaerisporangium krabiense]
MNVLDLARSQFAVTGSLHFLFVVLTLGLAPLVAIMQTRYVLTGKPVFERMTRFWGQIYVINYAVGVFTGLVMEFQFGLTWSGLSHYAGDVFGAPLAIETLVAFFLESTFLGLWIFGWNRLPKKLHLACIWLVTLTAYASAFWIMVANSFLQNPAGTVLKDGRLALTDFGALLSNPSLVAAFPHVIGAGLVTGSLVIIGASAYHLFRRTTEQEFFRRSLRTGVVWANIGIVIAVGAGYAQFGAIGDLQPGKFNGTAPGVALGFMIGFANILHLIVFLVLLPLLIRDVLARSRWIHPILMIMTPLPFLIAISGWLAREIGRQPWLVYGRLRVQDAMSPGLTTGMVTLSFAAFAGVLGMLAIVDYLLIARAVRRGPGQVALGAAEEGAPSPAPALAL